LLHVWRRARVRLVLTLAPPLSQGSLQIGSWRFATSSLSPRHSDCPHHPPSSVRACCPPPVAAPEHPFPLSFFAQLPRACVAAHSPTRISPRPARVVLILTAVVEALRPRCLPQPPPVPRAHVDGARSSAVSPCQLPSRASAAAAALTYSITFKAAIATPPPSQRQVCGVRTRPSVPATQRGRGDVDGPGGSHNTGKTHRYTHQLWRAPERSANKLAL
jgi:hypothetical protein